jgi:hypothetical protein
MAENLQFPILFDLEKGVETAIKDWDSKYADKLEKAIQKRALGVKLKFDTKAFDNLDDVKRRLAELKITPLTPENKQAIQELTKELKGLAKLMEKISNFKGIELPELQAAKAAKLRKDVAQADEKLRLSKERIRQAEERLILSQQRAARQAKNTGKAFGEQESYLSNLIKKMAVYASFRQVGNFLTSVREVTAQFELQRVSLGAILQDANKGEQIFSQIKQFALNSPLSILDMTRYTKQLAAYKIEYDELFEMTKRFADISVGLGVDYQRIVLAAGQTRTATYLRASELKQFTELGVPLLEELSIKLSKMNGEMVSTAEVMDMISKRAISWELVKEVLYDMTDAGGMFYNMQIQQGNTLYGLWQKLGDAASVMYEQIGNTGWVNSGMKEAIQLLTELMRNWKAVGLTAATSILPAVAAMAAWKMATKALAKSVATATNERIVAEAKLATAMKGSDVAAQNAARSSLAKAKADEAAAIAAQKNATAQSRLKMGFVSLGKTIASGLGIGIAVMLVTNLIYKFYEALTNFRKLKRELGSIYTETATLQDQSVRNFESLADKAVHAAAGSKEQTDALQELNRTYRDILPQMALTIENLTKMKGKYDALTQSIREYVAEQQKQKAESAIMEYYGTKIRDAQNDVRERLYDQDLSATEVGRFFAEFEKVAPKYGADTWGAFREAMLSAGVKDKKLIAKIWKKEFEFTQRDIVSSDTGNANIRALSDAYADQANELKGMNEQYREAIGQLGKFSDMQKRVSDTVANATYKDTSDKPIDADKQGDLLSAMKFNLWVKKTASEIQNNEDIQKAFEYMGEGIKSEWFNIINALDANNLGNVSQINFDAIIASVDNMIEKLGNKNPEILTILNTFRNYLVAQKKEYENMAPSETVIVRWRNRWRAIVSELKISGQNMNRFLMQSSEDFEAYRKRIKEEVTAVINQINILNEAIKARISARAAGDDNYTKEQEAADKKKLKQAEERKKALQKLLADLDKIEIDTGKNKKGGGTKSDNRLSILKELFSEYKAMYDEYKKLSDTLGADKAADKMEEVYGEVAKQFKKYGLEIPMSAKKAADGMQVLIGAMEKLRGAKSKKGQPLFATLEKDISSAKATLANFNAEEFRKEIEKKLKALADRISRTKTAKEFYEKILNMTGDIQLSANLAVSVYGQNGQDLQDAIREQIRTAFETDPEKNVTIDLSEAIDPDTGAINYNKLAELEEKYKDVLIGGRADLRQKLIDEGRKTSAAQAQQWLKDIEKAKDFAQQRIDLATYTANQIAAINARTDLPQADKDKLTKGYQDREAKQLAKLQYDEFKDSAMYVHIFEDLDHASTTALKNMRDRLIALKGQWQHLDPTQVKELTKAIADLDEQIAGRSPFKSILDGFKGLASARPQKVIDAELLTATEELTRREEALTAATKKYTEAQTAQLNAQAEVAQARQDLEDALAVSGGEETAEVKAAREVLGIKIATFNAVKAASKDSISAAKTEVDKASEKYEEQKKVIDKLVEEGKIREANIKKIELANQKIDEYQQQINEALDGVRKMMEAFGASDEDMQFSDDVAGALNEIVDAGQQAAMSAASFMSGNILGGITSGVSAIGGLVSGFTNLFSAGKVRKANKEIKRQQELLDQLEYTHGRLEKAADKVFGADFVANMNQQQKVLQAQAAAYQKQYEAELSKGKKADEEKLKEYQEAYRDTLDEIADMQGKFAERMAGTDVTSAARDFAQAWLEAYASFGDTVGAMKEKFNDLIKNMIVESVMAKTVQMALQPMFDHMDEMYKSGKSMTDVLNYAFSQAAYTSQAISDGLEVNAHLLESLGFNVRDLYATSDNLTGISRDIATASEKDINGLAAHMSTVEYYASTVPGMASDVAAIRVLLEGGAARTSAQSDGFSSIDYTPMFSVANQHLQSLPRIEEQLGQIYALLNRTMVAKGGKFGFNSFYNS